MQYSLARGKFQGVAIIYRIEMAGWKAANTLEADDFVCPLVSEKFQRDAVNSQRGRAEETAPKTL